MTAHHTPIALWRAPARRVAVAVLLLAAPLALSSNRAHASAGQLQSQVNANSASQGALQAGLQAANAAVAQDEGRVSDLRARLSSLQNSLDLEARQLSDLKTQLSGARLRLAALQLALAIDRRALVGQLVAQYESPPPDITSVVFESHGFGDLLERVDQLHTIARHNAQVTQQVGVQRAAVAVQTARLADLAAQQQRVVAASLVQRDEVAQVKLAAVDQELRDVHARDHKSAQLATLRARQAALTAQLNSVQSQETTALSASSGSFVPAGAGFSGGAYAPHGGDFGFFPAAGTNYSVGSEPEIASRLDAMAQALHLHLIGISGYRSPAHSIAVGGFPDDPHTRGQASDTPGVEGVPQSVLARFGLERPFPGAAEADHIQLLGSPL